MNKQELLKDYKKQEDKICLSQVLDKIGFPRYVPSLISRKFFKKK